MAKAKEAKKMKDSKKKFSSDVMVRVAEAMWFKDKQGFDLADFNSAASGLTDGSHETNAYPSSSRGRQKSKRKYIQLMSNYGRLPIRRASQARRSLERQ